MCGIEQTQPLMKLTNPEKTITLLEISQDGGWLRHYKVGSKSNRIFQAPVDYGIVKTRRQVRNKGSPYAARYFFIKLYYGMWHH